VTPYVTYIKWLETRDNREGLAYWRQYLEGYDTRVEIPYKETLTGIASYKPGEYILVLEENLSAGINKIASRQMVTANTLFQASWGLLLQKYNLADDVVFGTVVSGRPSEIEGIEDMIGLFINTVPVRINVGECPGDFSQLLGNIQQKTLLSHSYEYVPLAEIQAVSYLKDNLIHHIMAMENFPITDVIKDRTGIKEPPFLLVI
jgi:hypothetical protein